MTRATPSSSSSAQPTDDQVFSFDVARYLAALRRYGWLIGALVAVSITAAVFYTERQTEIFEARASVQIEPRLPDLLGQGQGAELVAVGASNGATIEYYRQQRQVLGSYQLLRRTVEDKALHQRLLGELERSRWTPEVQIDVSTRRLQGMVKILYPEQNRIMYIVVRNANKQLAMDIANSHLNSYLDYSKGLLSVGTEKASAALETEFGAAEKLLRDADSALYQFQKDNDLIAVSIEDRQNLVSGKIQSYSRKFDDAHAKSRELYARLERLRKAAQGDAIDSPVLAMAGSNGFDALRAEYYTQKNAFEELGREVGPKTIEYAKAKGKVDALEAALRAEARRVVGAAEEEHLAAVNFERDMAGEVERYKKEALELGPKIVGFNEVARKKKSVEDKYNILVARLSTSQMTGRMNRGLDTNVQPLDWARLPTEPVSPDLRINLMVATSISVVLGVALVFLLVFLDRSVKSAEDAQNAAAAPVLGIVPVLAEPTTDGDDQARDLYVHQHPASRVAECCRSLRTNIVFSGADRPLKTIVVSSANPREGKTTLVLYLGTTMAQSGQRVLLVDTDMRRPRLHASTGVPRGKGLSNLIVGEESYDDAIKSTVIPNLYVLPCGPLPPNPAELLMSKRFTVVLEELKRRFDRIILDSPPLGAVTDGVVLSTLTDGVALVVRADKTLRDDVKRSVRQIRDVDGHIIGVVLNQFDAGDRRGYGYYQYYGYGEKAEGQLASAR